MLTDADWDEAHRQRARSDRRYSLLGLVGVGLLTTVTVAVALLGSGAWRYAIAAAFSMGLGAPMIALIVRSSQHQMARTDDKLREMGRRLNEAVSLAEREVARRDTQASRQQFESRLANALDMADGEAEVLDVIERSLGTVLPDQPTELLLADNSHAHLLRMAAVGFGPDQHGCSVDSPSNCPAARRAQTQIFQNSGDLDACPKLRNRSHDPLSAICVPVSIMGRTVGVIHSAGHAPATPTEDQANDLATLAKLSGTRLGMLRVMAETELQAATDSLTGLLNRRSFEQRVIDCRRANPVITLGMADLDFFKLLNDTYGHETGDRALRLFARILRESLRAEDVVCRYGGEEFALALPACTAEDAIRVLDSVRARLEAAITVSGLPMFTASFGLAQMQVEEDMQGALGRADAALFVAKREGRDRVEVDQAGIKDDRAGLRARDFDQVDPTADQPPIILDDTLE